MSPGKSQALKTFQKSYDEHKFSNLKQLAWLVYAAKFIKKTNSIGIEIAKARTQEIKLNLLCKKFVKKLHAANKMRLSIRNRNTMTPDLNIRFISCFLFSRAADKAEFRLYECFENIMFKQDIMRIAEKSLTYLTATQKIQQFYKRKRKICIDRFSVLSEAIKGRIFESERERLVCYGEYMDVCRSHTKYIKYNFVKFHR